MSYGVIKTKECFKQPSMKELIDVTKKSLHSTLDIMSWKHSIWRGKKGRGQQFSMPSGAEHVIVLTSTDQEKISSSLHLHTITQ